MIRGYFSDEEKENDLTYSCLKEALADAHGLYQTKKLRRSSSFNDSAAATMIESKVTLG